jgi:type I restriction enzyme, R subunit
MPRTAPFPILMTPEQLARTQIDAALEAAGWVLQNASQAAVKAARGVAVREFPLAQSRTAARFSR